MPSKGDAMSAYDIDKMSFSDLENRIKLPKYQRPVVWTDTEKKNFISSLHRGFPFGSLLLYRYPDDLDKYSLIDGQQRFTTMRDYAANPCSYFPLGDYDYVERIMSLVGAGAYPEDTKTVLSDKFSRIVKDMLLAHVNQDKNNAALMLYLRDRVTEELPTVNADSDVRDRLQTLQQEILNEFDTYLDLNSITIPCIIFKGSESELPDVFASVNLGGRKLTKYQVFAAQWNRYDVPLLCGPANYDSGTIMEDVIARYESLTNDRNGLEIEDFDADDMRASNKVSLPEFCHALGQEIMATCPACWPMNMQQQDDAVDTIGYLSLAIVFGLKPQEVNLLAKQYNASGYEHDGASIDRLVTSIKSIYSDINDQFAPYLIKPGKVTKSTQPGAFENSKALGQLQFLSFFAALWRIKYGPDNLRIEELPRYKDLYKRSLHLLFGGYLIDFLTDQWKGSGDSRLAAYITGDRTYLSGVSRITLQNALSSWAEREEQAPSINIDTVTKVLLTIFATANPSQYQEDSYDFEHIVARKLLNDKDGSGTPLYKALSLPGGRIGNIMLLSSSQNRSKHEKNLGTIAHEELQIDTSRNFLPEKKDLDDIEYCLRDKNPEPFLQMMRNRKTEIFSVIVDRIMPA